MATVMLVHGAHASGWFWHWVEPMLSAVGHEVYAPTLTGLGERAHLAGPGLVLATHVDDVVGVIELFRAFASSNVRAVGGTVSTPSSPAPPIPYRQFPGARGVEYVPFDDIWCGGCRLP